MGEVAGGWVGLRVRRYIAAAAGARRMGLWEVSRVDGLGDGREYPPQAAIYCKFPYLVRRAAVYANGTPGTFYSGLLHLREHLLHSREPPGSLRRPPRMTLTFQKNLLKLFWDPAWWYMAPTNGQISCQVGLPAKNCVFMKITLPLWWGPHL